MAIKVLHWTDTVGPVQLQIPTNQSRTYRILGGHIICTTSATGGARRIRIGVHTEDGHVIQESHSGANQAGSQIRHYNLLAGTNRETTFQDDEIEMGIPEYLYLLPGWVAYVEDSNNIDVTNDLFTVHLVVEALSSSDRGRRL